MRWLKLFFPMWVNLCPFCSPCLTAASLSVSLTVPSTACLPACLLSGTKEFRSVSVQIPVTRTKTNATEKMQQHQKTLLASLCSDFPHFPTLGSCNYTICLYCCPLRVTMRATYNNHCPIKARMKQEEEGVLFLPLQHLSTKMCVSLICLQMQLSVFCQPGPRTWWVRGPQGAANTFWENIKCLWQPVIKPAAERMPRKGSGGKEKGEGQISRNNREGTISSCFAWAAVKVDKNMSGLGKRERE